MSACKISSLSFLCLIFGAFLVADIINGKQSPKAESHDKHRSSKEFHNLFGHNIIVPRASFRSQSNFSTLFNDSGYLD